MILRRGVNGLLGQLVNEGLLPEGELDAARALAATRRSPTPWFVRVLIGVGAWVSAGLLVLFFALTKLIDSATGAAVMGAVLYVGGALLRRATRADFAVQLSLAAGIGGAGLLVGALASGENKTATLIGLTLLISLVTLPLYPDVVLRFVATGCFCVALVLGFHELALGPDGAVAAIALAGGLAWHFQPRLLVLEATRDLQRPVAWGLVVSLLGFMVTTVTEVERDFRVGPAASLSVGLALVVLIFAIAREQRARLTSEPVVVAVAVVIALGAVMVGAPGVLAALFVSALAFHRRSPLMLSLAIVFLVVFLGSYYFHLELSLLRRSLVLLGSGAVLFGVREYARRRFGPIALEELP